MKRRGKENSMNRNEALQDLAQRRGVDTLTAKSALEEAEREAISALLQQIAKADDSKFLIPKYIEEIVKIATANGNLPEIADLLLEHPNHSLLAMSDYLGKYQDDKAVLLLRQITTLDWASEDKRIFGANALIDAVYRGDARQAMTDESELVCFAAARQIEAQNDVDGLIEALLNSSARVRSIAAWYLGRNRVDKASNALLKMLDREQDGEVLRAVVWALGVLRTTTARSSLQPLLNHPDSLIRGTVREALDKLP